MTSPNVTPNSAYHFAPPHGHQMTCGELAEHLAEAKRIVKSYPVPRESYLECQEFFFSQERAEAFFVKGLGEPCPVVLDYDPQTVDRVCQSILNDYTCLYDNRSSYQLKFTMAITSWSLLTAASKAWIYYHSPDATLLYDLALRVGGAVVGGSLLVYRTIYLPKQIEIRTPERFDFLSEYIRETRGLHAAVESLKEQEMILRSRSVQAVADRILACTPKTTDYTVDKTALESCREDQAHSLYKFVAALSLEETLNQEISDRARELRRIRKANRSEDEQAFLDGLHQRIREGKQQVSNLKADIFSYAETLKIIRRKPNEKEAREFRTNSVDFAPLATATVEAKKAARAAEAKSAARAAARRERYK